MTSKSYNIKSHASHLSNVLGGVGGDTLEVQNSMNDQLSLFDNGVNNIIQIVARSFTICIVFYLYFALNHSTTLNESTTLGPMGKMKSFFYDNNICWL